MKVLVTGAAGYIGSVVARELSKVHEVTGTDVRPMPDLENSVVLNLNDTTALHSAMKGKDAICHIAWPMGKWSKEVEGDFTGMGLGVRGTFQLLKSAVSQGIKRVIFQSTINIIEASSDSWRITEEERPRPGIADYTLSKTLIEEMCRGFARVNPLTIAVFRIGGVPTLEEPGHEKAHPARHYIPSSCVERRDIAQAYDLALTRPLPSRFEVFHIFHNRPGSRFPIDKAKTILGYAPRYNFEDVWQVDASEQSE